MRYVYLHGFASSPQSSKAQFFRRRLAEFGIELVIPALDGGDFEHLTITGQLRVVDAAVAGRATVLFGSSLGGYLAALYAARHTCVGKLVLLAPAFQFPARWRQRYSAEQLEEWKQNGSVSVFHYGYRREVPLSYQIMEDSLAYENEPDFRQPALILHGNRDPVVPVGISRDLAASRKNVTLRTFDSGHELTDVLEDLFDETRRFLDLAAQVLR